MIEGKDPLLKKITLISNAGSGDELRSILNRLNKAIVQADAKLNCSVNHGELRESIYTSINSTTTGCEAKTFTNKPQGMYVEFGTGPRGQASHEGISPQVNPSYVQHGWAIPADKVDAADAEKYKWPKRIYGDKEYYLTSGQPAQPFLYPALKNNEERVKRGIKNEISKNLKKVKK